MRRISKDFVISDLPDLVRLSQDHQLYLRHMLGLLETGDMFHGRFVEVHVGNLLGADIADRGINGWDLRIDGTSPITVEVKAAAVGHSYHLGPKDAEVWVFVTFDDKTHGTGAFRYCVASAQQVADTHAKQIRQAAAFSKFGEVTAGELPSAVRAAAIQT